MQLSKGYSTDTTSYLVVSSGITSSFPINSSAIAFYLKLGSTKNWNCGPCKYQQSACLPPSFLGKAEGKLRKVQQQKPMPPYLGLHCVSTSVSLAFRNSHPLAISPWPQAQHSSPLCRTAALNLGRFQMAVGRRLSASQPGSVNTGLLRAHGLQLLREPLVLGQLS